MKNFLQCLKQEKIIINTYNEFFANHFDFQKHIKNSIYSFICQGIAKKSFSLYFIHEKIVYFKENTQKLKKFFTGLITFIENLDDLNKKQFYWYLLNLEVSRKIMRKVYNTNHKLMTNSNAEIKLKEFYEVVNFIPIFRETLQLNDVEYADFHDKVAKNTLYKQYISVSFIKLCILEIYLLRENVGFKKLMEQPSFKEAKKNRTISNLDNLELKNEKEKNIFLNVEEEKRNKKPFSCFRFNLMPTYPCQKNGRPLNQKEKEEKIVQQNETKKQENEDKKTNQQKTERKTKSKSIPKKIQEKRVSNLKTTQKTKVK